MGDQVLMRNSALYENFTRLPPSIQEIHVGVHVCMRNSVLNEKFVGLPPAVREIHVGVPAVREKFIWVFSFV